MDEFVLIYTLTFIYKFHVEVPDDGPFEDRKM